MPLEIQNQIFGPITDVGGGAVPVDPKARITEDDRLRITEDGQQRITE